jgi:hypothetical protein
MFHVKHRRAAEHAAGQVSKADNHQYLRGVATESRMRVPAPIAVGPDAAADWSKVGVPTLRLIGVKYSRPCAVDSLSFFFLEESSNFYMYWHTPGQWHAYVVENDGGRWPELQGRQLILLVPHPLGLDAGDAWECPVANGAIR